jgi:hypothetical protein
MSKPTHEKTMTAVLQIKAENRESAHTGPSRSLSGAPVPQELTDCHAAEHLLVGTHSLDDANNSTPVCLTCRFQGRAA